MLRFEGSGMNGPAGIVLGANKIKGCERPDKKNTTVLRRLPRSLGLLF